MPFNSIISRDNASATIPEDVSLEILEAVTKESTAMRLARRLRNMARGQMRMPVMSALATGYFVNPTDTGKKQTTSVEWDNKYVDAAEIAAIVPISEAVLDDSSFDIWGAARESLIEAFGIVIDGAVFYGTDIPATWTTNMGSAGIIAGLTALSLAGYTDMYEALLAETGAGVDGVWMEVEADGYAVTGAVGHLSMRGKLRNTRDSDGLPIFNPSMQDRTQYTVDGVPIVFPLNGVIDSSESLLIAGQWDKLVYSVRQDMTFKIFTEGVVQDASGEIVYNLMQQDMVALRAVMRVGFALPKPINRIDTGDGYPFAALVD